MFQSLLSRFGVALLIAMLACSSLTWGGNLPSNYKVLSPISHGNLTIFPVVAASTHDTSGFITLDEGIRSGEVVVTEAGLSRCRVWGRSLRPDRCASRAQLGRSNTASRCADCCGTR